MSRRDRRAVEGGFTLIEMMVALLIFGMLAAAGVALLSFSVRAQAITGARLDDIAALNRFSSVLSADLAEAVDRPTRDETGTLLPAFQGGSGSGDSPMLALVRGGWTNLDDAARASLQRVDYRLDRGTLERIAYPMLDGAPPLGAAVMMRGVREIALRYRLRGAWSDRWEGTRQAALPEALEMQVTRADGTAFRTVLLVGTGYTRPRPPAAGAP
ncbi:MAG: type II secretion system protein GspJ [Sphingomonas sp. 28-66-16]|nr:MAG: type II secretion system protein GspJ [Sphingomonas sp. 28-66-16]